MVHNHSDRYRTGRRLIRWAVIPFRGKLGEYVGVALERGEVLVAVRTNASPRWVYAADALSPCEAEVWARTGFRRRRELY